MRACVVRASCVRHAYVVRASCVLRACVRAPCVVRASCVRACSVRRAGVRAPCVVLASGVFRASFVGPYGSLWELMGTYDMGSSEFILYELTFRIKIVGSNLLWK